MKSVKLLPRFIFARYSVLFVYAIFIFTIFFFQLTPWGIKYKEVGEKQWIFKVEVNGERGLIYDRNGVPIALNVPYLKVYKNTQSKLGQRALYLLQKYKTEYAKIYEENLDSKKIGAKIALYPFRTEPIPDLKNLKNGSGTETFYQKVVSDRFYPFGCSASPVVGCIGADENPLGGLELVFDKFLKGKPGKLVFLRDAKGNLSKINNSEEEDPKPGKSIITTLDITLQEICYLELKKQIETTGAKRGFVIVTNPNTGEILALVSYPANDPNLKIPSKNIAIEDPYEPGSTFKLITYVTALENKLIKLTDTIPTDNGRFVLNNHTITDEHPEPYLTVLDAFVYSSNIAAAKIGLKLGAEKLYATARRFGFGMPSGIGLPGESAPPLKDPSKWSQLHVANFAFGYGVLVNGIQMAMAYGAVANGGYLLQPRILKNSKKVIVRKVLEEGLCDTLKIMMKEVVERGTGKKAKIPGVEVCGKTGTSKMLDPATGEYTSDAMIGSFIGFFPKDNPKYLIYVVIFEPKGPLYARFGGEVAAPVFRRIGEFLIGGNNVAFQAR